MFAGALITITKPRAKCFTDSSSSNRLTGETSTPPIIFMRIAKTFTDRVGRTKGRKQRQALWVAVKVERGFICAAKVFESLEKAEQVERKWRARFNPDYDEVAVVKTRLAA